MKTHWKFPPVFEMVWGMRPFAPILILVLALAGCATPAERSAAPAPQGERAALEERVIDAVGALPALATMFDVLAAERARQGVDGPADQSLLNLLRAIIERGKPELAAAFSRGFETAELRAFAQFLESPDGQAYGRLHEEIVALTIRAVAMKAGAARAHALSAAATAHFWSEASEAERRAAEAFLASPDGERWIAGFDDALGRLLDGYQILLTEAIRRFREMTPPEPGADEDAFQEV